MKCLTKLMYTGKHEIIKHGNSKYLHCPKPTITPNHPSPFDTKVTTLDFLKEIVSLDTNDHNAILEFVNQYGLLAPLSMETEQPTYCGHPISKELAEIIYPTKEGFLQSLELFSQNISIVKNIAKFATEIALHNDYKKENDNIKKKLIKATKTDPKNFEHLEYSQKMAHRNLSENTHAIVDDFLTLLYQPYNMPKTLGIPIYVISGNTPLSRFHDNFYNYFKGKIILCKKTPEFICFYNRRLEDIITNTEQDNPDKFTTKKIFTISLQNEDGVPLTPVDNLCPSQELIDDAISYRELLQIIRSLDDYIDETTSSGMVKTRKNQDFLSENLYSEITKIIEKWGPQLIADTINTYSFNINYEIHFENGEYKQRLRATCMLQNIFLELGNILDSYQVVKCRYPGCENLAVSLKSKPNFCCCHNHNKNYHGLKKRRSKKLLLDS